MNDRQSQYHGLRFDRPRKLKIPKAAVIGAGLALFTLVWWLVPHEALYWLLLPVVGALGWVASFGWRAALVALHDLLNRLERL